MAGYLKKIAVIKQVKSGFSADGGLISGLVKAETYAGFLKVEVSLLNFAPLSEGRYVFGISDGANSIVFEDVSFECETSFDMSSGFAFLVCFCHGEAAPVASAYCGNAATALPSLKEEIARREKVKPKKQTGGAAYDDEAISEINYYENQIDKDGQPLREDKEKEQLQIAGGKDETPLRPVKVEAGGLTENRSDESLRQDGVTANAAATDGREEISGGLANGDFYSRMQGDIERIFASFPPERDLEEAIEGSRFVKIGYGQNRYYVFGVLTVEGNPVYICYGVPSADPSSPPKSLAGCSSYIPCKGGVGYWMTYQDARTGVSVDILST